MERAVARRGGSPKTSPPPFSMCGITGAIWSDQTQRIERDTLVRMTDMLRHRGPDDEGFYTSDVRAHHYPGAIAGVALGHRRLSIIDVAGSRFRTKTRRSGSFSTARSTTSATCIGAWKDRGTAFEQPAIRKRSFICTKTKGLGFLPTSKGCSRWQSGMPTGDSSSWHAIG